MRNELVLDLETKKSFDEVGGRSNYHLLEVSLVGTYDYQKGDFSCFNEDEITVLINRLKAVDRVVGFNIKSFDWRVLQPYTDYNLSEVKTIDIMDDAVCALGQRVSLNNLAGATLGYKKSGHGLEAIKFFREGRMDELKRYCLDDVRITRDLYEFGLKDGYILATVPFFGNVVRIPVAWS